MITVDCRNAGLKSSGIVEYQRSLANHLPGVAPAFHFQMVVPEGTHTRYATRPNAHELALRDEPISLRPGRQRNPIEHQSVTLFHDTTGTHGFPTEVPIVSTIHDAESLTGLRSWAAAGVVEGVRARWMRHALLAAAVRSVRIIVPSEASRRQIAASLPSLARKLRVVPNGVAPEFVPLDPKSDEEAERTAAVIRRLVPGATSFVLSVGQASPARNHKGMLRAFARAFRRDVELHLVLVQAHETEPPWLAPMLDRLGLEGRVHLLKRLPLDGLVSLYQKAVCLCYPSSQESYPTPVVQAMACGCPVVTSSRGAIGEIAEGAAQLVNPEHDDDIERGLVRVVRHPEIAKALSEKGLKRAQTLTAGLTAEKTWQVYDEALAERARTG